MLQQLHFIPQTAKRSPLAYPRNGLLMCKSHHSLFDSFYFFLRYRMEVVSFCETSTNSLRTENIISSMPPMSNASNNSMDDLLILTQIHHMLLTQTFSFTMKLFVAVDGIKIMKPISLARPAPRYILLPPPHQFTEASLGLILPLHCHCLILFHPQVSLVPPRK